MHGRILHQPATTHESTHHNSHAEVPTAGQGREPPQRLPGSAEARHECEADASQPGNTSQPAPATDPSFKEQRGWRHTGPACQRVSAGRGNLERPDHREQTPLTVRCTVATGLTTIRLQRRSFKSPLPHDRNPLQPALRSSAVGIIGDVYAEYSPPFICDKCLKLLSRGAKNNTSFNAFNLKMSPGSKSTEF